MRTCACILEMYVRTYGHHHIHIARLIIEHPREWLASLVDSDHAPSINDPLPREFGRHTQPIAAHYQV